MTITQAITAAQNTGNLWVYLPEEEGQSRQRLCIIDIWDDLEVEWFNGVTWELNGFLCVNDLQRKDWEVQP